ncbi:hypothetical protein OIU77_004676 [Salix suchowensis]|uniref:Uncharacterized protein n=1 Tax=Salix suchowensis TaxID=1278906 RepID=A0ABQ9AV94_9ROSI|nr:hypothetical protein OIU77_004676 [Salix suchowensis]
MVGPTTNFLLNGGLKKAGF